MLDSIHSCPGAALQRSRGIVTSLVCTDAHCSVTWATSLVGRGAHETAVDIRCGLHVRACVPCKMRVERVGWGATFGQLVTCVQPYSPRLLHLQFIQTENNRSVCTFTESVSCVKRHMRTGRVHTFTLTLSCTRSVYRRMTAGQVSVQVLKVRAQEKPELHRLASVKSWARW
jgi:hypothetical protein